MSLLQMLAIFWNTTGICLHIYHNYQSSTSTGILKGLAYKLTLRVYYTLRENSSWRWCMYALLRCAMTTFMNILFSFHILPLSKKYMFCFVLPCYSFIYQAHRLMVNLCCKSMNSRILIRIVSLRRFQRVSAIYYSVTNKQIRYASNKPYITIHACGIQHCVY